MNKDKMIKQLRMIAEDMENDAGAFEGAPFNGRTVAEYFGNQGAAISTLADIMRAILELQENQHETKS